MTELANTSLEGVRPPRGSTPSKTNRNNPPHIASAVGVTIASFGAIEIAHSDIAVIGISVIAIMCLAVILLCLKIAG